MKTMQTGRIEPRRPIALLTSHALRPHHPSAIRRGHGNVAGAKFGRRMTSESDTIILTEAAMNSFWRITAFGVCLSAAQDMMRHVDLTSSDMTSAELTRDEVAAAAAAGTSANPVDFTGKRLSG